MPFWLRVRYCCNNDAGSCQHAVDDDLFSPAEYRRLGHVCRCGQPLVEGKPLDLRPRALVLLVAVVILAIVGKPILFPPPLEHVQFAAAQSLTRDDVGMVAVDIDRNGDLTRAIDVDYATIDGSAKSDTDYVAASGRVSFAAGESKRQLAFELHRDVTWQRGRRHFHVVLRNVRGEPRHTVVIEPLPDARADSERVEQSVRNASVQALEVAGQVVRKRVLHDLIAGADADEAAVYRESLATTNENLTRAREAYLRVLYDLRTQPPGAVLGAMDRVAGHLKTGGYDQQAQATAVMKQQLVELLDGGRIDMDRWAQELSAVIPRPAQGETRI